MQQADGIRSYVHSSGSRPLVFGLCDSEMTELIYRFDCDSARLFAWILQYTHGKKAETH